MVDQLEAELAQVRLAKLVDLIQHLDRSGVEGRVQDHLVAVVWEEVVEGVGMAEVEVIMLQEGVDLHSLTI